MGPVRARAGAPPRKASWATTGSLPIAHLAVRPPSHSFGQCMPQMLLLLTHPLFWSVKPPKKQRVTKQHRQDRGVPARGRMAWARTVRPRPSWTEHGGIGTAPDPRSAGACVGQAAGWQRAERLAPARSSAEKVPGTAGSLPAAPAFALSLPRRRPAARPCAAAFPLSPPPLPAALPVRPPLSPASGLPFALCSSPLLVRSPRPARPVRAGHGCLPALWCWACSSGS